VFKELQSTTEGEFQVKYRAANAQTLRSNRRLRFSFSTNTYYTVKEERNNLHKKGRNEGRLTERKTLVICYIWGIALYGVGTWTFRKVYLK